jgi:hypothetical protein
MNTPIVPQLYAPSPVEIMSAAASAKRRHPALASRIDKAAAMLLDGSLQLNELAWSKCQLVQWRVASQTGKGAYVIINRACPCRDSRHNDTSYCKHEIAANLLMKVLRNRFNADIRAREIDLGILPDGTFNAWAPKLGIVAARKLGTVYTFADDASAIRYSIWLAAQPVAVEWPVSVAVAA